MTMLLSTVLCAALFAPAAEDKPKDDKAADLIVGKWVCKDSPLGEINFEFTKDGTFTEYVGLSGKGKYKVVNEKTLELTYMFDDGKSKTYKKKLTVTKDKLTLEPGYAGKGKTVYTRAAK
jgi:hypothetical protein